MFLDDTDAAFNFSNVFQRRRSIHSNIWDLVRYLRKFVIHQNCWNPETRSRVDSDNALKEVTQLIGKGHAQW